MNQQTVEEREVLQLSRAAKHRMFRNLAPRCVYCRRVLRLRPKSDSFRNLAITWDHVIPLSRGGRNEPDNLVLCCRACNEMKGDRTPAEWAREILRVEYCPTLSQRLRMVAASLAVVLPFLAAKGGAS